MTVAQAIHGAAQGVAPKRVVILGATGSIGASTLSVIAAQPGAYEIEAVTANANASKLAQIARATNARIAAVCDPLAYGELKEALAGSGITAAAGPEAVVEVASRPTDAVVAAIVGAAGLAPTYAALKAGNRIALANKECLVSAGHLFTEAARQGGAEILPVDSEHNAVFQILDGREPDEIDRVVLTASGGPFREWTLEEMEKAGPEQALNHPNWSMGDKITIDSATLMNKGLEIIEAYHLFGLPPERLGAIVHPQSIVHALVTFTDGTILAGLSAPDMRTPIAHALSWPERAPPAGKGLDVEALGRLDFETPDLDRFPALRLARAALDAGGWATNVLNAANEVAVGAFLGGKVGFLEIAAIVEETITRASAAPSMATTPSTIDEAIALDREGRRIAAEVAEGRGASTTRRWREGERNGSV